MDRGSSNIQVLKKFVLEAILFSLSFIFLSVRDLALVRGDYWEARNKLRSWTLTLFLLPSPKFKRQQHFLSHLEQNRFFAGVESMGSLVTGCLYSVRVMPQLETLGFHPGSLRLEPKSSDTFPRSL